MYTIGMAGLLLATLAGPGMHTHVAEKADPAFERVKALSGEWEGSAAEAGKAQATTRASIRAVSAGSAVMLVTDADTPHEMVTLFHRDDGALMVTHYCAAMNQPRMKARPGTDPNALTFDFLDATNLAVHPGHMQRLVLRFVDADHHTQEWTFRDGDQETTAVFELHRKKQ